MIAALDGERLGAVAEQIDDLARQLPVYLGGPGAESEMARRVGAHLLAEDLITAAASF